MTSLIIHDKAILQSIRQLAIDHPAFRHMFQSIERADLPTTMRSIIALSQSTRFRKDVRKLRQSMAPEEKQRIIHELVGFATLLYDSMDPETQAIARDLVYCIIPLFRPSETDALPALETAAATPPSQEPPSPTRKN